MTKCLLQIGLWALSWLGDVGGSVPYGQYHPSLRRRSWVVYKKATERDIERKPVGVLLLGLCLSS